MENTNQFKEKLNLMKHDIIERIQRIEISKTRKDGVLEADSEEQAKSIQNDEVIDRLDEMERKELKLINSALLRIDEGTYGICKNCGESINNKRLEAIPFTTLCIDCAQELH